MSTDNLPAYPDQPELALVAALNLITRYSTCHSPALANAAVAQLRTVAGDKRFSSPLRECAQSLIEFWLSKAGYLPVVQGSSRALH
ncbi:MAG TPA: hypothetical protein VL381_05965 [Rhodocyclaceae bacterium]|nr:hypothetical protein [Rhodocyclaceae bacterium]